MRKINIYQTLLPYFFKLDPEFAHDVILALTSGTEKLISLGIMSGSPLRKNPAKLMDLKFENRIGLAAGLDKNASHIDALSWLGFGFIEVGTVTPKAQSGNPKPRLFRLPEDRALINRMGFNNDGLNVFVRNLKKSKWVKEKKGIIGINLGMNYDTKLDNAYLDYEMGMEATYEYADYIVVNVSSPNTKDLRKLQERSMLEKLLSSIKKKQNQLFEKYLLRKPIFIKLSPDINSEYFADTLKLIKVYEVEGVIATNTTTNKENIKTKKYSNESGGLSGGPLFVKSNQVLSEIRNYLPNDVIVVGSGGIMSGDDANLKFMNGANLIQLYSGLIFSGPGLVKECIKKTDKSFFYDQCSTWQ
tara:strand:+ start:2267 stop:3343 length:1077 start_codon:yes stop_codon:yes gene_type:complete